MPRKIRKRAANAVILKERVDKIVELRKSGLSQQAIAERVGLDQTRVSQLLREYFQKLHDHTMANLDVIRAEEIARLDSLLVTQWRTRANPRSASIILAIGERKSKLLGLDAASKTDLNVNHATVAGAQLAIDRMTDEHLGWLETLLSLYGPGSDPSVVATQ